MWSFRKEIHKLKSIPNLQNLPCNLGMDVVFLLDYTGSMGPVVEEIKSSIAAITSTIENQSGPNDYRLSLVLFDEIQKTRKTNYEYKDDYNNLPEAQKNIRTDGPITNQYTTAMVVFGEMNNNLEFNNALSKLNTTYLPLGYGYQAPEPLDIALDLIVNSSFSNPFRNNIAKYILLYTDAQPSGNDDAYGSADDVRVAELTADCIAKSIKVMVLGTGAEYQVYKNLATNTGGAWSTSYEGSTIVDLLTADCTN